MFCSPLPDGMIPEQPGNNNEFLVCYDLVKIWKLPFKNPHKKDSKYKIDGEKSWHTIGGVIHRMDVDKNTWLVGVQFATYIPNNSNVQSGRLNWKWETNREYAECYNLAECDMPIEIREKRGDRTQFSISTATHDVLQTLDGYDDSGN